MGLHVHLDPVGGVAGDMFISALVDARPELADGLLATLAAIGAPAEVAYRLSHHHDGALSGRRFAVTESEPGHGAQATPFKALRARLEDSGVAGPVKARAIAIFTTLAEAEARVHGGAVEDVAFHELGTWDSVADVVGAAHLIEAMGAASWSSGPLPQGAGTVKTAHGLLPVPAPAAAALLEGFVLFDDGLMGERITPTGAAIIRHLAPDQGGGLPARHLRATGTGFGTRTLPGKSNVLRVLLYESAVEPGPGADTVAVIDFEVDDQAPDELAVALDRLRAADGVLDVVQWPVSGKKGRAGARVQVLARPELRDDVIERCFVETTTIGLRWRLSARAVLERETVTIDGARGPVRVKLARRPGGGETAKADIAPEADGQTARRRARQEAEAAALRRRDDGGGENEPG